MSAVVLRTKQEVWRGKLAKAASQSTSAPENPIVARHQQDIPSPDHPEGNVMHQVTRFEVVAVVHLVSEQLPSSKGKRRYGH